MRSTLTQGVIAALEAERRRRGPDAVEVEHDAFLVFGGMGPCRYITRAGRFLVGKDDFWGEPVLREAEDREAVASLRGAARRLSLPELLTFIPPKPPEAVVCDGCEGSGRSAHMPAVVCLACSGTGWHR
jgi:hypothetical protein